MLNIAQCCDSSQESFVLILAEGNQNGQGNQAIQASKINPAPKPPKRSLLGQPLPKPAPSNSANAIQGNSVNGAADGGSEPYADKGGKIYSTDDGNANNYGPVTSGNRKPPSVTCDVLCWHA